MSHVTLQLQLADVFNKVVPLPQCQFLVNKLMLLDQPHKFEGESIRNTYYYGFIITTIHVICLIYVSLSLIIYKIYMNYNICIINSIYELGVVYGEYHIMKRYQTLKF